MQPYEQVPTSLPSKYNEPYTKPCNNRYQQLEAIHLLPFPCIVFHHRCLTLSSVMNVVQSHYCLVDVTNLEVHPLCSPFSIPAARSSMFRKITLILLLFPMLSSSSFHIPRDISFLYHDNRTLLHSPSCWCCWCLSTLNLNLVYYHSFPFLREKKKHETH